MSRSVNVAIIIGNLTRDPEMRYTPQGHAVTSFAVATNRRWVTNNEEKEEAEFHNVVGWNKLAELCHQLLKKGTRVYIQGRLQTRSWQGTDGVKKTRTEIVADDMVVLDSGRRLEQRPPENQSVEPQTRETETPERDPSKAGSQESSEEAQSEDVPTEEIPF